MGVTFSKKPPKHGKGLGASNKFSPEGFLLAYSVQASGETALVSVPMVDKLSVHGPVPISVYAQMGDEKVSGAAKLKSELSKLLKDEASGAKPMHGGEHGFAKGSAKSGEVRVLLKFGQRPAWGFISLRPSTKDADDLILRIDWNPRKAGREGIEKVFELLIGDLKFSKEEVGEWLGSARVTRMDIAVDILDVERCDLRARIEKERKVQSFGAPANGLETSYHKEAKSKQFPVVLYDKRQHYLDTATPAGSKPPKFGQRAHCRVERVWRFGGTSQRPLSTLAEEKNRLDGFDVRWLRDRVNGPTRGEQRIAVAALNYLGKKGAKAALGKPYAPALKVVETADPEFWRPDVIWSYWKASLEAFGLDQLITPHTMFRLKT